MKTLMTFAVLLASLFWVYSVFGYDQEKETYFYDKLFNETHEFTPSPDELVIVFNAGSDFAAFKKKYDLEPTENINRQLLIAAYRLKRGTTVNEVLEKIEGDPMVKRAAPAYIDHEGHTIYFVPTDLTVRFKDWVSEYRMMEILDEVGSRVVRKGWPAGYFLISAPENRGYFETIRELYLYDEVKFAEPSIIFFGAFCYTPNDAFFEDQWALNNTGQVWQTFEVCGGCNDPFEEHDINAKNGWDIGKGHPDVVICTIDTGMDLDHPDLDENLLPRNGEDWDFTSSGLSPDDFAGHGTACAGVAVAETDNSIGVAGIAHLCQIMPLKATETIFTINAAINYAASRRQDFDGLVLSNSYGFTGGPFPGLRTAVENAYEDDVVICCAAGNRKRPTDPDPDDPRYPAAYPQTISITATSPCDERKSETSCDNHPEWIEACYGDELDVAAPGVYIYTTDLQGEDGQNPEPSPDGDYHDDFWGTSAACPHVAGIAGVVWSIDPDLTNEQIYDIIRHSADQVGGYTYSASTGKSLDLGHGRVNLHKAALLAQEEIRWAEHGIGVLDPLKLTHSHDVFAIDLDDDDDVDMLSTEFHNDAVIWWENDGSENWTKHTISTNVDGAKTVCAGDLDNDGDVDIVAGGQYADGFYWWKNDGSENFTEFSVSGDEGTIDIYIEKIDSDNYYDVLGAVPRKNKIIWWENDGQGGFTERSVVSNFKGASSAYPAHLNSDSDMDIIGASKTGDKISWFENDGDENFTQHALWTLSTFDAPSDVYAEDMDGDDDMDILACSESESYILIWENTGTLFSANEISGQFEGAMAIYADTLSDNDYRDIIVAAPDDNAIFWWENEGDFEFSEMMTLGWDFAQAWGVHAADIDGDDDIDILGAAAGIAEKITWWESDLASGPPKRESDDQIAVLPERLIVSSPYPNPFNATITIQYDLPADCHVTIDIYDILGRHVTTLVSDSQPAGSHHMIWDAADRSSGIYFYKIQAGEFAETKKMTLLK